MRLTKSGKAGTKLELSRAQNPRRVAWYLLHVQAGNDNYIDLLSAQIMLLKLAQVEGCRTSFGGGV